MLFTKCELEGVVLIEPEVFKDERGYFLETFKASAFASAGIKEKFYQDNFSVSGQNVLRGLHFQLPPHAQAKLVRAVFGRIWDVAVDIRKGSPTFGKWFGTELSDENNRALYVPGEFAHGFVVLSEQARVLYKTTSEYAPDSERGIRWDDPEIKIQWPVKNPLVGARDKRLPAFAEAVRGPV